MGRKTSPITDKNIIKQIKRGYIKNNNNRDLLLFILSINTGLKITDILKLKVKDVKGKDYLNLPKGIEFPLKKSVQNLISKVIEKKTINSYLFASSNGKKIDRSNLWRNFKAICEELELRDDISLESWRKTFGYNFYIKYKDLLFLQWYLGHTSPQQTMEYIGVQESLGVRFRQGLSL